jgi:hypothetical protein
MSLIVTPSPIERIRENAGRPALPAHGHYFGLTKREAFALEIFKVLARNGIYSEGEAIRYADLLLSALETTPIHDPQQPPA